MDHLIPLSNKDIFQSEFLGKKASQNIRKLSVEKTEINFRPSKHQETRSNASKARLFSYALVGTERFCHENIPKSVALLKKMFYSSFGDN
jgi:hypothetical protein